MLQFQKKDLGKCFNLVCIDKIQDNPSSFDYHLLKAGIINETAVSTFDPFEKKLCFLNKVGCHSSGKFRNSVKGPTFA